MFRKNRSVWGIATLVASYVSFFIALVFHQDNNKPARRSMIMLTLTLFFCGALLLDEEYDLRTSLKDRSTRVAGKVKNGSFRVAGKVKDGSFRVAGKVKDGSRRVASSVKRRVHIPTANDWVIYDDDDEFYPLAPEDDEA